jgi:hypothetical protein
MRELRSFYVENDYRKFRHEITNLIGDGIAAVLGKRVVGSVLPK